MTLQDDEHLQNLINGAPIGIAILDAGTLRVELLNDQFIEIAGKPREAILGKWYWEPFAEARPYYEAALADVAETGETYRADEVALMLIRHGQEEIIFVTFIYAPVKNADGKVSRIAVWVLDNTAAALSRNKAQELNEQLATANENLIKSHDLADKAHQKKHAELKGLFNHAPVAMATFIGPKFVIGLYNELVLQFWGRTAEQVAGLPLFEALSEAAGQGFEELLTGVYTTGNPFRAPELPVTLFRNGRLEDTFIDFIYEALRDETGKIYGILVVCVEITEQVQARNKVEQLNTELQSANDILTELTKNLTESEARFRKLAEGSEIMISVNEVNGDVIYVNQAWLNLTGQTQEAMQEYGWGDFLHPDDQEQLLKDFRAGIDSMEAFTVEFRMMNAAGEPRYIYTRVNPRFLPDGSYGGTISSSIDITDRVKANAEVEDAIERLNVALDAGNFGTTEVDLATGAMVCNERFKNLFGRFSGEEMVYADMFEAMLPKYREAIRAQSQKAQRERSLYEATYEIKWPDGSIHWIEAHGRARYGADGKPNRMVGILADVTEQVKARTALEQAEIKLRLATEAAALGTWYINAETLEFLPSVRLKELFGFGPDEVMPYAAAVDQIAESHRQRVTDAVSAAIAEGKTYDIEYPVMGFHDGRLRWVRATGRLFKADGGEPAHFSGTMIDITEQVAAMESIRKSGDDLRISRDETQLAIDAAALATFDYNPSTGKFKGNQLIREWFGLQPEEEIELSVATSVIADADRERVLAAIAEALKFESGGNYEVSYTIINPLDPVPRVVKAFGETQFNERQEPVRLSGVLQDITEQRQDEQRKNDFISMVSHELKTPLTSLLGYVQMLQLITRKQGDEKLNGVLEKSQAQVKKMTTMINGFLDMSRFQSGKIYLQKQEFLLNQLLEETVAETLLVNGSHEISFVQCAPVLITADRDKIGQVVTNLLSNAVKYSPKGSRITVSCQARNKLATVSVTDEGVGINQANREKLFDRFFRVEGKQAETISGFGIGLYLSAEIIERHQGKIWVESEPGEGSTFYFEIPIV